MDKFPAKIIALYFPQFHRIPENDEWWGAGFTDWDNVKKTRPQFINHHQPRVPLGNNYYDQSDLETLKWQINLAKEYGIYGFCHYHYWFDGKQLLETPTNLVLNNHSLDFPFCLSWANETWSRRWDGLDHHVLIKQTHPPIKENWKNHFDYLYKAWSDSRAIRINEKPVFIIYRPHRITQINQMLDYWRDLAERSDLGGLYIIAQKQYEFPNNECLNNFDAVFQFQPFESIFSSMQYVEHSRFLSALKNIIPARIKDTVKRFKSTHNQITFYDYDAVWENIINNTSQPNITTFPGAFVDWDNTPRYKERATIFTGATPQRFEYWLNKLVNNLDLLDIPKNFIFLNAWNEWAEGAYLEPDTENQYLYLRAIQRIIHDKI